jgi:hypothetical protein
LHHTPLPPPLPRLRHAGVAMQRRTARGSGSGPVSASDRAPATCRDWSRASP